MVECSKSAGISRYNTAEHILDAISENPLIHHYILFPLELPPLNKSPTYRFHLSAKIFPLRISYGLILSPFQAIGDHSSCPPPKPRSW